MDYQKAYFTLFNQVTDIIQQLTLHKEVSFSIIDTAISNLKTAQQFTEDLFINHE